jgi:alkanesulfonate monooxygenase SsuD/methylene tetrahydromethanopterin reductase-like flavin-dependent oxidoreductase (luciferase family)
MAAGVAGPTTGRNRRAARRSEEQVEVVHALWAEPHVTFNGKWHTI